MKDRLCPYYFFCLTCLMLLVPFHNPWKHQETSGLQIFSGYIERDQKWIWNAYEICIKRYEKSEYEKRYEIVTRLLAGNLWQQLKEKLCRFVYWIFFWKLWKNPGKILLEGNLEKLNFKWLLMWLADKTLEQRFLYSRTKKRSWFHVFFISHNILQNQYFHVVHVNILYKLLRKVIFLGTIIFLLPLVLERKCSFGLICGLRFWCVV